MCLCDVCTQGQEPEAAHDLSVQAFWQIINDAIRSTGPARYSSVQTSDRKVASVSGSVLGAARRPLQLMRELAGLKLDLSCSTEWDQRAKLFAQIKRLEAVLEISLAFFKFILTEEADAWGEPKVTLRAGGVAVYTQEDNERYGEMVREIQQMINRNIELVGGGSPVEPTDEDDPGAMLEEVLKQIFGNRAA